MRKRPHLVVEPVFGAGGHAGTQFSLYANVLKNNSVQFDDYVEWMGGVQLNYMVR